MSRDVPEYCGFKSTGVCQWIRSSGWVGTVESAVCCALPACMNHPGAQRMPAPSTELRTLRFGHSPDADDAYMFYGFHTGDAVIDGCRVEHVLADIQSLNVRAIERADLEITACSAHAYAHLADRY